jgi:hypothetical protein
VHDEVVKFADWRSFEFERCQHITKEVNWMH